LSGIEKKMLLLTKQTLSNMHKSILCLIVLCLFITLPATAQISIDGIPYSLIEKQRSNARSFGARPYKLTALDNQVELRRAGELKKTCSTCRSNYYGTGINASINIKTDGQLTKVEGGSLWKLVVESETALGMQFYFDKYKLPAKASLYIYNDDFSQIVGAFTHINNHIDEKFATKEISGNRITLEYFEADGSAFAGQLHINKIIHVFDNSAKERDNRNMENGRIGDSSCEINIHCPEGQPFLNERKAVCRISFYDEDNNFTKRCSGFLVNNGQSPRKAYVMTADHCLHHTVAEASWKKYRYSEWIFEFDYESKGCLNGVEPLTFSSANGAVVVTRGIEADYALLDLQINAFENYANITYLGWNADPSASVSRAVGIHHPEGDLKKVSLSNIVPLTPVYAENGSGGLSNVNPSGSPKTHWQIYWTEGHTEEGSSGSPIIDQFSKLAVGQLSGGNSYCSVNGPDYYGRIAHAWNTFDPPYTQGLGYYLNPGGSLQTMPSFIPYPEGEGLVPPEGGGTVSGPNKTGVTLSATHVLGEFNDLNTREQICNGSYPWKVSHGWVMVKPQKNIILTAFGYSNPDTHTSEYSTGIYRSFPFIQGKEYVISMKVYGGGNPNPIWGLGAHLTQNSAVPKWGCNASLSVPYPNFSKQTVMFLPGASIQPSKTESSWFTFAQKFVPSQNYNTLYINLAATTNRDCEVWVDRISIHENGDFINTQCVDTKTFNDLSSVNDIEMANISITAAAPIVPTGRNILFQSRQIILSPGFQANSGTTFRARVGDCIGFTSTPLGPLEKNIVSGYRSIDDSEHKFVTDYSGLQNVYLLDDTKYGEAEVIETEEPKLFSLTPNPAHENVTVKSTRYGQHFDLMMQDISGKVLYSAKSCQDAHVVSVRDLSVGIYIIQIKYNAGIVTERLIVK
jgi:hypothetical protein